MAEPAPSPLDAHAEVIAASTAHAWTRLAPFVADWMCLAGGTALAIRLHHRTSRDLDVFSERPSEADEHAAMLTRVLADFVATGITEGTVTGVLGSTKIQFRDA